MKHVELLYNTDTWAMVPTRGWHPTDLMESVYTSVREHGTDREICNELFLIFNTDKRPVVVRSMSVGDVVVIIDDKAYSVDAIGFNEVPKVMIRRKGQ